MNKAELVSQIAESAGLTKIEAEKGLKWTPKSRQKSTEFKLYIQLQTQQVGAAPV